MSPHLSPDEISNWMVGPHDPERALHLRECAACAREVESLQSALHEFKSAVGNWDVPPVQMRLTDRRVPLAARWALLAAAALALAVAPVYLHQRQVAADAARADALLLKQVDEEVSQAVPAPMEPLASLVSWNSSQVEGGDTQ